VGDCLQVYPHVLLGLLVLGEEEQVWVVLLCLGILLHRLGILLQGVLHRLEFLLVALPWEAVPIRRGFLAARSFFCVYLEDLLDLVRLLSIGLHHLR
jgi:hypothetical protein